MDEGSGTREQLIARIRQLEDEREQLHKDIEKMCMRQSEPSYPVLSSLFDFQRTDGLEEEMDILKANLASCTKANVYLHEMLSEAYRVKAQLSELQSTEISKNIEADRQIKFFQGCVAEAYSERDHSLVEAEKAKENEELMLHKLKDVQNRVRVLEVGLNEATKNNEFLQCDLVKQLDQNRILSQVINKFYKIRCEQEVVHDNITIDEKCEVLLDNSEDTSWHFQDSSVLKYIGSIEEERDVLARSVETLQLKVSMGLQIESHLKKRVGSLQRSQRQLVGSAAALHSEHSRMRAGIEASLDDHKCFLQGALLSSSSSSIRSPTFWADCRREKECPPEASDGDPPSEILRAAMREKVEALLLLSQVEERQLFERNVAASLRSDIEDLKTALSQVTSEKVGVLMSLAQLENNYYLLLEKFTGLAAEAEDDKKRLKVMALLFPSPSSPAAPAGSAESRRKIESGVLAEYRNRLASTAGRLRAQLSAVSSVDELLAEVAEHLRVGVGIGIAADAVPAVRHEVAELLMLTARMIDRRTAFS